ncbi:kinase-like domain-containing protein [Polychytrium aggregatum]|uniref:kinase-like domain-containing protein n=1 Tax=Polychytrium aggregatum TaxID=110093 RepID=UPI0022FF1C25|nr:kinase-like domain-containing protein [Polychytrium aggregatum]KAI9193183.1 kinase-like domain-containing protein [Polychytrium aggregatum]
MQISQGSGAPTRRLSTCPSDTLKPADALKQAEIATLCENDDVCTLPPTRVQPLKKRWSIAILSEKLAALKSSDPSSTKTAAETNSSNRLSAIQAPADIRVSRVTPIEHSLKASKAGLQRWEPETNSDRTCYQLHEVIGTGTFAQVHRATDTRTNTVVAVKVAKSEKYEVARWKREMYVLSALRDCPNIVTFQEAYTLPKAGFFGRSSAAMVLEYSNVCSWSELDRSMNLPRIRSYTRQLLQALDYCHSLGIMHRDVKPQNILYDIDADKLLLADWGQAEFYEPLKRNSTNGVSSLYFKAPELLLDYEHYDFAVDMWAVGCILAALMFRTPFVFKGEDRTPASQFQSILLILGGDLLDYCSAFAIPRHKAESLVPGSLSAYQKQSWASFVNDANRARVSQQGLSLLESLLCYNHRSRYTASEALVHPFFAESSTSLAL